MPRRFLVLDAYAPEGREALRSAGGSEAGQLYRRMLEELSPGAEIEIAYPADPAPDLPSAAAGEVDRYDGVAWTGSSLTIHDSDDVRVQRQVDFAREVFEAGVPSFGSCWAAQLAVVAAGGRCAPSPRGREFGVARKLSLSDAGSAHPLFRGKPPVFDGFTSHADEIVELAGGATPLASNGWSAVQAVSVEHGAGRFWALQYHPEYDLHEVASLCRLRTRELVDQGSFESDAAARRYIDDLEALHADPARDDLAQALEIGPSLRDERIRTLEVANWLDSLPERSA